MSKVIFLDVDGTMIPTTMAEASWSRRFLPETVLLLNEICIVSGAKVVFNTTHSLPLENAPDIEQAIVAQGLSPNHLHVADLKTRYPEILDRKAAVKEWLDRHPETTEWVALDDEPFTEESNLVLIDGRRGLEPEHFLPVVRLLGLKMEDE